MEQPHEGSVVEETGPTPPPRNGSREQRREETLRALAAGEEALCAFCARPLPPLPSRGGRPTPYCPADPQRYGHWGAKVISCAMLDEHREIWVQVFGADQPMTQLDLSALDDRLAALTAVLDPARTEITALREHARTEARTAREEQTDAEQRAQQANTDRDTATAQAQDAAREAETARGERQHALDLLGDAHQRITELQEQLAADRAAAVERLDQQRSEAEHARQTLQATLAADYDTRLAAQQDAHARQLQQVRADAEQRIGEITAQLTRATQDYAAALAPLHEQLATRTAEATTAHNQYRDLREALTRTLAEHPDEDTPLRHALHKTLHPDDSPAPSV